MPMERRLRQSVAPSRLSPGPSSDGSLSGYSGLDGIHAAARRSSVHRFGALAGRLSEENLRVAFRRLDGSKAVGVDRISKQQYARNLGPNLGRLSRRLRSGRFWPKPSREVHIPKPQGGTRPLAIGCVEDRMVQILLAKVLEAIHEPSFHRHSYGFRPHRSAHQAVARLHRVIAERPDTAWVVEMDIEKFFNQVDHGRLMGLLEARISDEAFLRLIRNCLTHGILSEDGRLRTNEAGTPQGSPLSPVLANLYLDTVLDQWFEEHWADQGEMVRYADDAVFVFSSESQARAFRDALEERFGEWGLRLNQEKSGVRRFDRKNPEGDVSFLGFTYYWGHAGKKVRRQLKVKTTPKRLGACIQKFKEWIKFARHRKRLKSLWDLAKAKLRGHYGYYGVTFNQSSLSYFYHSCVGLLFRWLNRRSQKRSFTWESFGRKLMFDPLPRPVDSTALVDITGQGSAVNHKLKSRMRKLRTSGSVRSRRPQGLLFT
jgi:RNA-directed DNA polymerase